MSIPFRFIHCADLHLGAPFKYIAGIDEGLAEAVRRATYRSFNRIVDLAVAQRVDAIVIAGDVYNEEERNLSAQVAFAQACERLTEAGIRVFVVHGNHDVLTGRATGIALPEGVHVFGDKTERVSLTVGGREVAAVYGCSLSPTNVRSNISDSYRRRADDAYAIGILHATVGSQAEHEVTAPCSTEDLLRGQMDYWALGHIHKRSVLSEHPFIVYAGNPQGLHRNEPGAKGCYLVRVGANGHTDIEFCETNTIRFESAEIDVGDLRSVSDIEEMIRHKKELMRSKYDAGVLLALRLTGRSELHDICRDEEVRNEWKARFAEGEGRGRYREHFVYPYRIDDETRPAVDLIARRGLPDMVGSYLAAYDETGDGELLPDRLRASLEARPEWKRLGRYGALLTDERLGRAWRKAETEGVAVLTGDEDEH